MQTFLWIAALSGWGLLAFAPIIHRRLCRASCVAGMMEAERIAGKINIAAAYAIRAGILDFQRKVK